MGSMSEAVVLLQRQRGFNRSLSSPAYAAQAGRAQAGTEVEMVDQGAQQVLSALALSTSKLAVTSCVWMKLIASLQN